MHKVEVFYQYRASIEIVQPVDMFIKQLVSGPA
jgi:hypothetical protein